jgi:hypothetical protein
MTRAELRAALLRRYETSAGEFVASGGDAGQTLRACPPGAVDDEYYVFRCRRCLSLAGPEQGSGDLAGLCDGCWCEVDRVLRGGPR